LLDAGTFREIVSGRRRGFAAIALRRALRMAELPYTWVVRRKNRAFDLGRRAAMSIGVPVISVGNLTLGGTGKTPMVAWLARWFQAHGNRPALVSRGYKSRDGVPNDEGRELAQILPEVHHLQKPDRVAAARQAIAQYHCDLILLDDGFQHRRLHRDVDIVLIDATEPFGFGHVFPRGTLREPLEGLRRADVIVLTKADMVDNAERGRIRGVIQDFAPSALCAECRHAPSALIAIEGRRESLAGLHDKRVAAFCGIGNPAGFRHTLEKCGAKVVAWREFPDHHAFNADDVVRLSEWAAIATVDLVVCTHKDLVKLNATELSGKPLLAVQVGIEFLAGQSDLEASLEQFRAGRNDCSKAMSNDN
jgi:tetraacyldisaccharide 4'-kinase